MRFFKHLLTGLALVLVCSPAYGAIALVAHGIGAGGATTTNVTLNCTGANFIVATATNFDTSVWTFGDTVNSYTQTSALSAGAGAAHVTAFYAFNATVSASMTFTITGTATNVAVSCWSGVQSSSDPLDQVGLDFNKSVGTLTITPTVPNTLVVCGAASGDATAGHYTTPPTGMANLDSLPLSGGVTMGAADVYVIQTSATAQGCFWPNLPDGPGNTANVLMSFKPAGGAPPATNNFIWP